jgi:small subunit ribosomal protein S6
MKNRYEALIVLNTQGREDTVKDIVDRLESEFQKEGAEIEQVQKMDKRPFSYVAGPLDSGFYVNFVFHADPQLITKLRSKFKLDPEVYRQHYQRLRARSEKKERKPKKLAPAK